MNVTLYIFKQALNILKENNLQQILDSLLSLRNHESLMKVDFERKMREVRQTTVHFKRYENQMTFRKMEVEAASILPWVPLLRAHQKTTVYPSIKKATVGKITDAKKNIDYIHLSVQEIKFKLMEKARTASSIKMNLKQIETQIFILETAADLSSLFETIGQKGKELAEFEVQKYYELYRREKGYIG